MPTANPIHTIKPYRWNGTWVFDDLAVALVREPFVCGIPEMIDEAMRHVPHVLLRSARRGLHRIISAVFS